MELDSIDKYIHMTKLAQGVEVMFAGQPCLKITEGLDSYVWAIYPVFAKLTYGANIFEDVPYCAENFDTMEEAIADGLAKLHSLGAFVGEVDLPEDTYAEEHLGEGIINTIKKVGKALIKPVKDPILDQMKDITTTVNKREIESQNKKYKKVTEEILEDFQSELIKSILQDCRAYATKHSTSLMEAHDLSLGLYESILSEADFSGVNADAKRQGKTHEQMAAEHRKYAANMRRVGQAGLASRSEALAKSHEAAAKVNEETLDEGTIKDIENKLANHASTKISNEKEFGKYSAADLHQHETVRNQLLKKKKAAQNSYNKKINNESVEETLDEAKALSGDAYWKSKEDAASEEKAKAARASAGIKEPEKKGRGKPTLGATVDEMKDRMRENIAAGKRPHTGFDRNEKLRILRSGAMEHPEFAGTHVKAAGRPVGTTKAAAIEKKKAEPTAFSMWAGLGKK